MLIVYVDSTPDRHTYLQECWVCNQPTMRVEEIETDTGLKVVEQCHAEHCDHRDEYYFNWED